MVSGEKLLNLSQLSRLRSGNSNNGNTHTHTHTPVHLSICTHTFMCLLDSLSLTQRHTHMLFARPGMGGAGGRGVCVCVGGLTSLS